MEASRALLIVDDDVPLRRMLAWAFEDLGYLVWTAGTCRAAVDAIQALAFDFALIDYHLPDGNGSQLGERLQQRLPSLRWLLMSADPDVGEISKRLQAERLFLPKPLHPEVVHRRFGGTGASG